LLGLVGLLIPFQITMWCLLQFKGSDLTSLVSVSGSLYFMGGIAMNIAGLAEFILGNSFPFAVFIIYGCHWLVLAYTGDPSHLILNAFGPEGMAGKPWNSGQGHYALVMALVSFIFLLGALRTNVPFVIMFFTLVILFGFIAVADYGLGSDSSPEGVQFAGNLLKIAGGFGIVTAIMGW
jgi:succinate-acetate transporter protein